jgi:hypothetical protein
MGVGWKISSGKKIIFLVTPMGVVSLIPHVKLGVDPQE